MWRGKEGRGRCVNAMVHAVTDAMTYIHTYIHVRVRGIIVIILLLDLYGDRFIVTVGIE